VVARPTRRVWSLGVVVLSVVVVAAPGGSGAAEEAPPVPVSSGVYTEEQAEAGREAFTRHCAHCHGEDLSGGIGPRLAPLDRFAFRDAPLSRPFEIMRTQMPFDAPGTLDDGAYATILAYVLLANGYPSGSIALPADGEALTAFVLDDPPGD
jgi:S-disulfanyl-L-cysteine oxidoreductase SoxD